MASAFWSKSLLEPEARRQNRWRVWNGLNECEVSCSFTWNMLPSKTLRWFGVFKLLLGLSEGCFIRMICDHLCFSG
jgi:hypothetical protein